MTTPVDLTVSIIYERIVAFVLCVGWQCLYNNVIIAHFKA